MYMAAVNHGCVEAVMALAQRGASVNVVVRGQRWEVPCDKGWTPLIGAAHHGWAGAVKALLALGACANYATVGVERCVRPLVPCPTVVWDCRCSQRQP